MRSLLRLCQQSWAFSFIHISGFCAAAGLKDGVPLEGEPAELLLKIVSGAFSQYPDALALTQQAIQDRPSRAKAYVA